MFNVVSPDLLQGFFSGSKVHAAQRVKRSQPQAWPGSSTRPQTSAFFFLHLRPLNASSGAFSPLCFQKQPLIDLPYGNRPCAEAFDNIAVADRVHRLHLVAACFPRFAVSSASSASSLSIRCSSRTDVPAAAGVRSTFSILFRQMLNSLSYSRACA